MMSHGVVKLELRPCSSGKVTGPVERQAKMPAGASQSPPPLKFNSEFPSGDETSCATVKMADTNWKVSHSCFTYLHQSSP